MSIQLCIKISEYDSSIHQIVGGPYVSVAQCGANCTLISTTTTTTTTSSTTTTSTTTPSPGYFCVELKDGYYCIETKDDYYCIDTEPYYCYRLKTQA